MGTKIASTGRNTMQRVWQMPYVQECERVGEPLHSNASCTDTKFLAVEKWLVCDTLDPLIRFDAWAFLAGPPTKAEKTFMVHTRST